MKNGYAKETKMSLKATNESDGIAILRITNLKRAFTMKNLTELVFILDRAAR